MVERRPPPAWLLVPHEQKARLELVAGTPLQVVRYAGPPPTFLAFREQPPDRSAPPLAGPIGDELVDMLTVATLSIATGCHG